jgi:hypothetical protein
MFPSFCQIDEMGEFPIQVLELDELIGLLWEGGEQHLLSSQIFIYY